MLPIDETILPFGGGGLAWSKLNVSVRLLPTKRTPGVCCACERHITHFACPELSAGCSPMGSYQPVVSK